MWRNSVKKGEIETRWRGKSSLSTLPISLSKRLREEWIDCWASTSAYGTKTAMDEKKKRKRRRKGRKKGDYERYAYLAVFSAFSWGTLRSTCFENGKKQQIKTGTVLAFSASVNLDFCTFSLIGLTADYMLSCCLLYGITRTNTTCAVYWLVFGYLYPSFVWSF